MARSDSNCIITFRFTQPGKIRYYNIVGRFGKSTIATQDVLALRVAIEEMAFRPIPRQYNVDRDQELVKKGDKISVKKRL